MLAGPIACQRDSAAVDEAPSPLPPERPEVVHEQRQPPGGCQDEEVHADLPLHHRALCRGEQQPPAEEVGVGLAKEEPADERRRHGEGNLDEGERTRPPLGQLQQRPDGPRHHHQCPMIEAPKHVIPAGPVPQARNQERGQQVRLPLQRPDPVAPERDVDEVAEPGRQRDVPAAPEVGRAVRDVGVVEVQHQLEPEPPRRAARDVRVGREVGVDLQAEGEHARPQHLERRILVA